MSSTPTTPHADAASVERTPWLLLAAAALSLALLALTTVQGALASNRHASAQFRRAQERELQVLASAGLDGSTVRRGRAAYMTTCTACHGPNGEALPNLGKDLAHSEWMRKQSDAQLRMFLKLGRRTWDPENTTKIEMPGKGGNPMLRDEDLADITQYLRYLQALEN